MHAGGNWSLIYRLASCQLGGDQRPFIAPESGKAVNEWEGNRRETTTTPLF